MVKRVVTATSLGVLGLTSSCGGADETDSAVEISEAPSMEPASDCHNCCGGTVCCWAEACCLWVKNEIQTCWDTTS